MLETAPEPVSLVRARGGTYVDITITEDSGTMAPRRTHEAHGIGTCFLRTGSPWGPGLRSEVGSGRSEPVWGQRLSVSWRSRGGGRAGVWIRGHS